MFKRFVSGATAFTIALTMSGVTVFADSDETNDEAEKDSYIIMYSDKEAEEQAVAIMDSLSKESMENDEISFIIQNIMDDNRMDSSMMISEKISDENIASPQWTKTTHQSIAELCFDSQFGNISSSQNDLRRTCMMYGAYHADDAPLHHNKTGSEEVDTTQLHAKGNYIINLEILWKYTKWASRLNNPISDSTMLTTSTIKTKIINSISNDIDYDGLDDSDKKKINRLLDTIPEIFNLYCSEYNKSSYRALKDTELKYLVLGLSLHLIGDIYAHKAFVPTKYGNKKYFTKSHFDDDGDLDSLIAEIKKHKIRGPMISEYMDSNISKPNKFYEDNKDFAPERYNICVNVSKNFVSKILNSENTYDPMYLDYSLTLQNMNEYIGKYGIMIF